MRSIFYLSVVISVVWFSCDDDNKELEPDKLSIETVSVNLLGDSVYFLGSISYNTKEEILGYGFAIGIDTTKLSIAYPPSISINGVPRPGHFSARTGNDFRGAKVYYCRAFLRTKTTILYGKVVKFPGLKADLNAVDFYPKEGFEGDFIKIYGGIFEADQSYIKVYFGRSEAEIIEISSDRMVVKVPTYEVAGLVPITIEKLDQRMVSEESFLLRGPVISSFTPTLGLGSITFEITGENFSEYLWRNKVSLRTVIDELHLVYDLEVIAGTTKSLLVKTNTANIPPASYQVAVSTEGRLAISEDRFVVTSPWKFLSEKPGIGITNSATFQIGKKIYVCGGYAGPVNYRNISNDLWEFDTSTSKWAQRSPFPGEARSGAIGFGLHGKGYVGMGHTGENGKSADDLWEYDPVIDKWAKKSSVPNGQSSGATVITHNGIAYVLMLYSDNSEFWAYDPLSDHWEALPPFEGQRRIRTPLVVLNENLYVIGGWDSFAEIKSDVWSFNFESQTWLRTSDAKGISPVAAVSSNGKCYLVHALTNEMHLVELRFSEYNPENSTITKDVATFPLASVRGGICVEQNGIVYFGLGAYMGYGEVFYDLWYLSLN